MTDFGEMSGLFKGNFASEPASKLMNAAYYFVGKMKDKSPDIDDILTVAEAINKAIGYANRGVGFGKSQDKLLVKPQNRELRMGDANGNPFENRNQAGEYPGSFETYNKKTEKRTGSRIIFSEYDSSKTAEQYKLKRIKE